MSETKTGKKILVIAVIAAVIIAAVIAAFFSYNYYNNTVIPSREYDAALALMNAGNYEEAIDAFTLMDGYKDSADKIQQCRTAILDDEYDAALALMNEGKFSEAITSFSALDYKDSKDKVEECKTAYIDAKYNNALALMAEGKYKDAGIILKPLNFKDSAEKYEECKAAAPYDFTNIGDIITFGTYEQDGYSINGREPLTWRVLDKQDGKLLIITEKALDKRPYFAIHWSQCYISAYVETSVMPGLSAEEKDMLVKTMVPADTNPYFPDADQGSDVENLFFLLSITEVQKYFGDEADRICYATAYAKSAGLATDSEGRCNWWLRTACDNWEGGATIAYVRDSGQLHMNTHQSRFGLRPACWIQLEG